MPRPALRLHIVLLPLLAVALAACAPARNDMSQTRSNTGSEQEQPQPPRRKLNPAPQRAYRITLTVADAPGPFASVEGVAQYDVGNDDQCGKRIEWAGVTPRITSNEPFELSRVSDTEYEGVIYADRILDEDYHGNGVCHWELTEVRARLRATGDATETRFVPDIVAEQVFAQQRVRKYFWSGYYPRAANSENYPELGTPDLSGVPADKKHEFFAITLRASETIP
jgi:hypothetical protein